MRGGIAAALALAALFLAGAARADEAAATISPMADEVERLQTRIAEGDRSAYPAEMDELKAMAAAIAAAKPALWAERREADALVVYVLSGGALAPVVPLVKLDAVEPSRRALVKGALAYVTNHEADALELLRPIDVAALDPRLAAPVAFARSMLKTRGDPAAALVDLDWARLIAPGGLVEEAALRREIALLVEARDAARVVRLTRQYAERFAGSLYAPDFFHQLAGAIARAGLADDPANYRLLSDAAARLPPEARRAFLLTLARAAALNGRFDAATAAAGEALRSAGAGSVEEARGRLYFSAGRIFSDGADSAALDLQRIPAASLDRSDMGLLAAVRSVAAQVRAPPPDVAAPGAAGAGEPVAGSPTVARAEDVLRRTQSLIDGGSAK